MELVRGLCTLFNVFTLLRLRRRLLKLDPDVSRAIAAVDPLSRLSDWLFPRWYNDLQRLQYVALVRPDILPLEVIADDTAFRLMRRLQKSLLGGILVAFAAASLG